MLLKFRGPPWVCCNGSKREGAAEEEDAGLSGVTREVGTEGEDSPLAEVSAQACKVATEALVVGATRFSSADARFSVQCETPAPEESLMEAVDSGLLSGVGLNVPALPFGRSFRQQEDTELAAPEFADVPTPSTNSRDDGLGTEGGVEAESGKREEEEQEVEDPKKKLMRLASGVDCRNISESQMINIHNPGNLRESYQIGTEIGRGSFGTVAKASVQATGAIRAIKSITKEGSTMWKQCLEKEILIFKTVDHPNIVKLYELFEDESRIHLVLEYCAGGELHDRIPDHGLTEPEAAVIMLQTLRAVLYLHKKHICHRDLKAQNILVSTTGRGYEHAVRIIDFGLSCPFGKSQVLTAKVGTYTHMSPQVLSKKYTEACDLWSCGVILFHLLSGSLPFEGKNEEATSEKVRKGKASFGKQFVNRSSDGVELIQMLLYYQEEQRYTPQQALNNRWIETNLLKPKSANLDYAILQNLRGFRKLNKLQRAILSVVASMLTEPQIRPSRTAFLMLDKDGDGSVSMGELRGKLTQMRTQKKAKVETAKIKAAAKGEAEEVESDMFSPCSTPRALSSPRTTVVANDGSRTHKGVRYSMFGGGEEQESSRGDSKSPRRPRSSVAVGKGPRPAVLEVDGAGGRARVANSNSRHSVHKEGKRAGGRRTVVKTAPEEEDENRHNPLSPGRGGAMCAGASMFGGSNLDKALEDIFCVEEQFIRTSSGNEEKYSTLDSLGDSDTNMPDFPYTEFLAATFDRDTYINDNICLAAFRVMDKDMDGKLSLGDIGSGALLGKIDPEEFAQILQEVDVDGDGQIDLQEFTAMLMTKEGWSKCFNRGASSRLA